MAIKPASYRYIPIWHGDVNRANQSYAGFVEHLLRGFSDAAAQARLHEQGKLHVGGYERIIKHLLSRKGALNCHICSVSMPVPTRAAGEWNLA